MCVCVISDFVAEEMNITKIVVITAVAVLLVSSCSARPQRKHRKGSRAPETDSNNIARPTATNTGNSASPDALAKAKLIMIQCWKQCLGDCKICCHCVEAALNPGGEDVCNQIDCGQEWLKARMLG